MVVDWLLQLELYYFQQESILPILQNLHLSVIFVLMGVVIITQLLLFDKLNQFLNLIMFPVVVAICYFLFGYAAYFLGIFLEEFSLYQVLFDILKIWPILIIVLIAFKIVILLLSKLFSNDYAWGGFAAPITEEFFYRFILINSIVLNGVSLFHAFFISSLLFGIVHITQIAGGKWWGGSAINYALVMGFIFGFITLYYGIIVTIVVHSAVNIVNRIIASSKGEV